MLIVLAFLVLCLVCVAVCQVVDVSALGCVRHLVLSGCNLVSDVSMLGTVDTLDISMCPQITDVSALGAVRDLSLAGNYRLVAGIEALGRVQNLNLAVRNLV